MHPVIPLALHPVLMLAESNQVLTYPIRGDSLSPNILERSKFQAEQRFHLFSSIVNDPGQIA
jgi:hypothetical protein